MLQPTTATRDQVPEIFVLFQQLQSEIAKLLLDSGSLLSVSGHIEASSNVGWPHRKVMHACSLEDGHLLPQLGTVAVHDICECSTHDLTCLAGFSLIQCLLGSRLLHRPCIWPRSNQALADESSDAQAGDLGYRNTRPEVGHGILRYGRMEG